MGHHDAAIGGTGSQLGLFRLDRDVLAYRPDLVFYDFTANDDLYSSERPPLVSYETILRELIGRGIPVVQAFFGFRFNFGKDYNLENLPRRRDHLQLAAAYQTGVGDVFPLIQGQLESGKETLAHLWPFDGAHPDDTGYQLFFEAVRKGFEDAVAAKRVCHLPEKPVFGVYAHRTRDRLVFLFAVGALLAPLAAIAVGGQRWFSLLDPVAKTLPSLVIEGTSLVENIRRVGAAGTLRDLAAFGLLLLAGLSAVAAPSLSRRERALVLWPVLVLLPLGAMAVAQNRWFMVVAPLASTLAVTTVVVWRTRLPRRVGIGLLAAGSILLIALFPVPSALSARHLAADPVLAFTPDDVFVPALRHYAQQLRRKLGPGAAPIVFAGPNESVLLAYYGGFPVLGTLYWENLDGMKAATAIATAPDLALARQLLAARRVGCLFSYPKGNFAREFATLASGHPDEDRLQRSFLMLLYGAERFPVWLRPIHLSPPTVLPPTPPVACYAFAPDQTEEEQVRAIADFLREDGRAREADALLRRLPAPESPRP